jgi:hypothetical protein
MASPVPPKSRHLDDNDEPIVDRIIDNMRAGLNVEEAAALAGVHPSTVKAWKARAGEDDAPPEYVDFAQRVEEARMAWRGSAVAEIIQAGRGRAYERVRVEDHERDDKGNLTRKVVTETGTERDPRLLLKLLEARWPGDFKRGEIEINPGAPLRVVHEFPASTWAEALKVLEETAPEAIDVAGTEVEPVPGGNGSRPDA